VSATFNEPKADLTSSDRARSSDLLYVSDAGAYVYVFYYPALKKVQRLSILEPEGLCSDSKGDVFVTAWNDDDPPEIFEYAHGASSPTQTLQDYADDPVGCSVDSTTGDLAVANLAGDIAVYKNASGTPTAYTSPDFTYIDYCGYDDHGNLFVDGQTEQRYFVFGELPKGKERIVTLGLKEHVESPGEVQWDGKYVTLADPSSSALYRLKVSGSRAAMRPGWFCNGGIPALRRSPVHSESLISFLFLR
jgi:hypothetical protein